MGVLGAIFGTTYLATRGGAAKNPAQGPPINAASKDEEQFIQCVFPSNLRFWPPQQRSDI